MDKWISHTVKVNMQSMLGDLDFVEGKALTKERVSVSFALSGYTHCVLGSMITEEQGKI